MIRRRMESGRRDEGALAFGYACSLRGVSTDGGLGFESRQCSTGAGWGAGLEYLYIQCCGGRIKVKCEGS